MIDNKETIKYFKEQYKELEALIHITNEPNKLNELNTKKSHHFRAIEVLERDDKERPERIRKIAEAYGDYSYSGDSTIYKIYKKIDEIYERISKKIKSFFNKSRWLDE